MPTEQQLRIAVGLSGGVDSSVTAALLKEQGHDVVGLTMAIYDGSIEILEARRHACYGPGEAEDIASCQKLCDKLQIPLHVIDLKDEYRDQVLAYVRSEYLAGRTPNPCVVCNHRLKFGFLLERAEDAGIAFDRFATGHYARIKRGVDGFQLHKALDTSKDQSYFLYALTPERLSRTLFPLGAMRKSETRALARQYGLHTADSTESQDFIAGGDYSMLFDEKEICEGEIVDTRGNLRGTHRGIVHYTVGQRKGLGIAAEKPLYVVEVDAANNKILVGDKENLLSRGLIASHVVLHEGLHPQERDRSLRISAKIRLRHKEAPAMLTLHDQGTAQVLFDTPQPSVTPGQAVVFYDGDRVLGGGLIQTPLSVAVSD